VDDLTKEFIAESQEGLERMEICLTDLEKRPNELELVAEIFRIAHTIKGTTGFLGFGRLENLAHKGENLLGALRDKKIPVTRERIDGLLKLMDGFREILHLIETMGTEGERSTDDDRDLIALMAKLKAEGEAKSENDGATAAEAEAVELPASVAAAASGSSLQDKTLRIDVEVLNRMMNLVGELVLTRNQILRCTPAAENFPILARRLDSVTAELRETVMRARMQPVGHLFSKFPRMVRDLGMTCGRRVRVEFEGQDTGLDKSLLEAVRGPLTHAVRNAVDHGVEPPQQRVKLGKPIEGTIRLRAFHQNGSVVIEVIDDGAGISTEKILAKATERGLLTAEQAAAMSQREALQMIFLAGFSTAKEVTSVSGRGVGMDVVRADVEKVGGSVELESKVGSGTTVRMRVPLTLAIVPALVVYSGGQSFALPQNSLAELVYVPRREAEQAVERMGTTELYRLREHLLPLVWLDRLLKLEQKVGTQSHGFYIAVLESEGRRYGLVVDDLKAPEEIVVKPLSAELREIGIFSGATVLGNGTLALILDVAATGTRAGVRPVAEEVKVVNTEAAPLQSVQSGVESSMVIYETGGRGFGKNGDATVRMAMPLSAVERIESVPIDQVEYAEGNPVLQYRGELIPLEDDGGVLQEASATRTNAAEQIHETNAENEEEDSSMATVLICLRPETHGVRRVGLVVRRVLDVSEGTLLAADAAACKGPLAMVKNHVTTVHRKFVQRADGAQMELLKEVA
jgi:two-component system chemotaxis sensor kinase CheA